MKLQTRSWAALPALVAMAGLMIPAPFAGASTSGRKNTAIGLGAAAAHQILTGKTGRGILLGAGAAYAYKRYQDAQKDERRDRRSASVQTRQNRGRYGGASEGPVRRRVMIGRVTDDAGVADRNISVTANGNERRLDVPKEATITHASNTLSVHELKEGDLVRVVAYQAGNDEWLAWNIDVLRAVQ
ncbi:MAG: hypothetical protein KY468_17505 [Armatimonadetes bacterium]|nr:hypothetical protein [Armatimonadota bacterium]